MEDLQKTPYFLWQPACWLRVTGEDALIFLQGQLTNELRKLIPNQTTYGLWLNQKGKVLADSFVIRAGEEEFLVGSYQSQASVIRERLEAYIIADDVTIEDETSEWAGMTLFSSDSFEAIGDALPGGVVFRGRRGLEPHWEWVGRKSEWATLKEHLSGENEVNGSEMELRRIQASIPAIPQDIGPDDLPNEGGLDRDAISYDKGCYLGQEVMARLKAMGQVRRSLLQVAGEGAVPSLPAPLFAGERQVGELRSGVSSNGGFVGLALITLMHLPDDKKLALESGASGMITVQSPL